MNILKLDYNYFEVCSFEVDPPFKTEYFLGAIQVIRDSLRGSTKCHVNSLTSDFMAFVMISNV